MSRPTNASCLLLKTKLRGLKCLAQRYTKGSSIKKSHGVSEDKIKKIYAWLCFFAILHLSIVPKAYQMLLRVGLVKGKNFDSLIQ